MIIQDEQARSNGPVKPEVFASYGHGIRMLGKNLGTMLLVLLIDLAINIPTGIFSAFGAIFANDAGAPNPFTYIYGLLVTQPLQYAISFVFLKAVRYERPEVGDLGIVFKNYWNIVLASFLSSIIVTVGFVMLIIPGFYMLVKLAFVPFLVTDKKMSATDAIAASWKMTEGHGWTIFGMGLLAIPVSILGLIAFGIGVFFSFMWIEAAFATIYYAVEMDNAIKNADSNPEPANNGPVS